MSWSSIKSLRAGSNSDTSPPSTPTDKCRSPATASRDIKISDSSEVVKRGSLYIKRPPSNNPVGKIKSGIKTWQKRHLVLRDTWTEGGDTVLELHTAEPQQSSEASESGSSGAEVYVMNLRQVRMVEQFNKSKTFNHAFIVFRDDKAPLVFGAKTELEMKEWLMAIKLLADKVNHHLRQSQHPPAGPARSISCGGNPAHITPTSSSTRNHNSPPSVLDLDPRLASSRPPDLQRPSPSREPQRRTCSMPQSVMQSYANGSEPQLQHQQSQPVSRGYVEPAGHAVENVSDRPPSIRASQSPSEEHTVKVSSSFTMTVKPTSDSARHNLTGDVILSVCHDVITLCRASQPDDVILTWPLIYIRKLKSESCSDNDRDMVTLQTTSQAGAAEGLYEFFCQSGCQLIQKVRCRSFELDRKICSKRPLPLEPGMLPSVPEVVTNTEPKTLPCGTPVETRKHCSSLENVIETVPLKDGRSKVRTSCVTSSTVHVQRITSSTGSGWMRSSSSTDLLQGMPSLDLVPGSVIVDDDKINKRSADMMTSQHMTSHQGQIINRLLLPARAPEMSRSTGSLAMNDDRLADRPPPIGGVSRSRTFNPPAPPPRPMHTISLAP